MQPPDIIQKMIETELFAAKHISEWIFDNRSQSWYDALRNFITFGDLGVKIIYFFVILSFLK